MVFQRDAFANGSVNGALLFADPYGKPPGATPPPSGKAGGRSFKDNVKKRNSPPPMKMNSIRSLNVDEG